MRRFVSYAKIMQTESIDASLLASYAEVQLILCKYMHFLSCGAKIVLGVLFY